MKNFTKLFFAVAITTMFAFVSNAQNVIIEDFSAFVAGDSIEVAHPADSDSEPVADWYRNRKTSLQGGLSPFVVEAALTYTNYVASGQGNAVLLDTVLTSTTDRASVRHFITSETGVKVNDDLFYVACLVNVSKAGSGFKEVFSLETASSGGNFSRGRIFVRLQGDSLLFAPSLNGTPDEAATSSVVCALNETVLLVMEYSYDVDGIADPIDGKFYTDSIRLYVNPNLVKTAAENIRVANTDVKDGYHGTKSWLGMNLRQTNGTVVKLSSIAWADQWDQLLDPDYVTVNEVAAAGVNMYVSAGELVIDNSTSGTLEVYAITGAKIFSNAISNNNARIQLGINTAGLYIARFVDANGVASVQKFTVK